jgi:Leu/Phe-tRNA-protein transferase
MSAMNRAERVSVISDNLIIVDRDTGLDWILRQLEERDEEFCHSFHFTRSILDRYCYHGFLPMSVNVLGKDLLSLKLHRNRVLLPPDAVRAGRNVRNRFSRHCLSFDRAFDRCVAAINGSHPDSWLSAPLVRLFARVNGHGTRVELHSAELWDGDDLVAGEIGYTVGASYTSLTGFRTTSSSGTAQLFALGKMLHRSGFAVWDLGMYAPYKLSIGGQIYPRESFLRIQASVRDRHASLPSGMIPLAELSERGNAVR